jgi:nitronate monooxygenase
MGAVAGGELAGAVSRAGGLGLIGPGYHGAAWIEREFERSEGARVGVGFITWDLAKDPDKLRVALAHRPFAVMLSFGDAAPFVDSIRRGGARLILQVQSSEAARAAARLAPDLIVAQGTEAGGHGASQPLSLLLPQVIAAAPGIPVAAAGGIATGEHAAAALALGAAAVLIGTRFFATDEALGPVETKQRIATSGGTSTLRTRVFDIVRRLDWPAGFTGRAIGNEFTARWHGHEEELAANLADEHARYQAAVLKNDLSTVVVWAGQGIDAIAAVEPTRLVMARLVREAELALQQVPHR